MTMKQLSLAGCAILALSGTAYAGPCDTTGKSAQMRDAGSGPTVGNTGQATTGSANSAQHPPTQTMNRAAAGSAASSEDVQKQTLGQPTAAQQAEGSKPAAKMAGKDC